MTEKITNSEWALLSSSLDGELTSTEKEQVETLLGTRPELQRAYQSLEGTRATLRKAALHKAPRNFTLTPQMVPQPRRGFRLVPVLRFSSAAVALIAAVLFFNPFRLLPQAIPMAAVPSENAAQVALSQQDALNANPSATPPPVIYWGGPPPQTKVNGMGGASVGALCPDGPCQYSGIGGGAADSPIPGDTLRSFAEEAPAAPEITPTATPEAATPTATPAAEATLTGGGPILGIQSDGATSMDSAAPEAFTQSLPMVSADNSLAADQSEKIPVRTWVAAGLLVLALAGLLTSFILTRGFRS